ncbi:hypothetical protein AX17_006059, partial [Amanita inopinata Kibby_2008]
FLYYDHALTFIDEINYIWSKRITLSSFFFILNRYTAFFGNAGILAVKLAEISPKLSKVWLISSDAARWNPGSRLLIYALYNKSLKTLAYMLGSGAILATICGWSLRNQKVIVIARPCESSPTFATSVRVVASWEALFVYDLIIFLFTLRRTWKTRKTWAVRSCSGKVTESSIPILSLILRDGAMYFGAMALATLANILTFYLTRVTISVSRRSFLFMLTPVQTLATTKRQSVDPCQQHGRHYGLTSDAKPTQKL